MIKREEIKDDPYALLCQVEEAAFGAVSLTRTPADLIRHVAYDVRTRRRFDEHRQGQIRSRDVWIRLLAVSVTILLVTLAVVASSDKCTTTVIPLDDGSSATVRSCGTT